MALSAELQQALQKIAKGRLMFNEPMREHTTIKIGGPADIWFEPADADDLLAATCWADEMKMSRMVFGNGSNTLVRDKGIRGMVISLTNFNWITGIDEQPAATASAGRRAASDERRVSVGAGVILPHLLEWFLEHSLSGLECVTGIPGTVGGAVAMNAGTKDGAIGEAVSSLTWASRGRLAPIKREELEFEYRKLKVPKDAVITEVVFKLTASEKSLIEGRINKVRHHRKATQPLLWPSLGSVFKNPKNGPNAWRLIDGCGLRGVRVGGARVSNEHANWIINEGNATAHDVEVLVKMIRERVKEESGVLLSTEIVVAGE